MEHTHTHALLLLSTSQYYQFPATTTGGPPKPTAVSGSHPETRRFARKGQSSGARPPKWTMQRNPPPVREESRQLATPPGAHPGVPARQAHPTRRPHGTQHPHGCQLPLYNLGKTLSVQGSLRKRPEGGNTHTHTPTHPHTHTPTHPHTHTPTHTHKHMRHRPQPGSNEGVNCFLYATKVRPAIRSNSPWPPLRSTSAQPFNQPGAETESHPTQASKAVSRADDQRARGAWTSQRLLRACAVETADCKVLSQTRHGHFRVSALRIRPKFLPEITRSPQIVSHQKKPIHPAAWSNKSNSDCQRSADSRHGDHRRDIASEQNWRYHSDVSCSMKPNLKRKQSVPNLNRARSDNWTRLPCRPQFRSSHGSTKLRPSRRFPPRQAGRQASRQAGRQAGGNSLLLQRNT